MTTFYNTCMIINRIQSVCIDNDCCIDNPSSSLSKKQGFPILSVRRWSNNTAYLVLTVHEVYLRQEAKKAK